MIRYHAINKFRVHEKKIELSEREDYSPIRFENDSIIFSNTTMFTRFLQSFGHVLTRITVIQSPEENNSTGFIGGRINEYCSESLVDLSLRYGNDWNILWKKSFKQLTKLNLDSLTLNCEYNMNMKRLSVIFPSLKHLILEDKSVLECLIQNFPHLEDVKVPPHGGMITHTQIRFYEEFMKQIHKFGRLNLKD